MVRWFLKSAHVFKHKSSFSLIYPWQLLGQYIRQLRLLSRQAWCLKSRSHNPSLHTILEYASSSNKLEWWLTLQETLYFFRLLGHVIFHTSLRSLSACGIYSFSWDCQLSDAYFGFSIILCLNIYYRYSINGFDRMSWFHVWIIFVASSHLAPDR